MSYYAEESFIEWLNAARTPKPANLCVTCSQTWSTVTSKHVSGKILTRRVCGCSHG